MKNPGPKNEGSAPDLGYPGLARALAQAALERLRVFPLPGAVLLPGAVMPLVIFEPRYRKMLADSLVSDRVIAVANLHPKPSDPPSRPGFLATVGVGVITVDERLEDGRSVIVLEGVLRAQVVEELEVDEPYRVVSARELDDLGSAHKEEQRPRVEVLRQLLASLAGRLPDPQAARSLVDFSFNERDAGRMADVVGGALLEDSAARQALLEEQAPARRLDMINDRLASVIHGLGGGTVN